METKLGDKKQIVKWAWLPVIVESKLLWMRGYVQHYEYKNIFHIREFVAMLETPNLNFLGWVKTNKTKMTCQSSK